MKARWIRTISALLVASATNGPEGIKDATGEAHVSFPPELTDGLWLQPDSMDDWYRGIDDDARELSEEEIMVLFRLGELTVTWQPHRK